MARVLMGPIQRALVVENPHPELQELLEAEGVEVAWKDGAAPSEPELIELLGTHRAQVLFKRSRVLVPRRVVEASPDLLAVQLCSIGDDSVDKQACADAGVLVFNDPVSNGRSVVELAVAHLISLSRRLYETDADTRRGGWDKTATERYEVRDKVLGVLGLGKIGRAVARAADRLDMKVRFFDNHEVAVEVGRELGWQPTDSMEELFRTSDYLTVHLSARDVRGRSNEGVVTRDLLMQLGADRPEGSPRIFLNLARGFLHSSEDLLAAVGERKVRRAAVDVYPHEPRGSEKWDNPYASEPRIALTPHVGASTQEAQPRIAHRVAATFCAFSQQGAVRDCVFAPRAQLGLSEDLPPGAALLAVVHANVRGTKAAIDDAIFAAGASNLASVHRDFDELAVAYDLAALDCPLGEADIERLVQLARTRTGRPDAVRSVRQVTVG